jgi:hypothetical protein
MPKGVYERKPGQVRLGARRRIVVQCKSCDVLFEAPASSKRKFCSRNCNVNHYKGANHPLYRTGKIENGYSFSGSKADHRTVAERALGRSLKSDEVVHHVDGNKLNNQPPNLIVMTRAAHQKLHADMSLLYARMVAGKKYWETLVR